jgi:glycosyltransferase involved in cell wall biosynthesis
VGKGPAELSVQGARGARVSVALCTYNGGRYLRDQLQSIAAQTVPPHELVVCDDGSTDDTLKIVDDAASRAPFQVRVFRNPANLGSTKNFEQAIQRCDGDLIALSDQDDVWRPEKLERMVGVFSALPHVGAVFSDGEVVDDSLRPLGYRLWDAVGFDAAQRRLIRDGRGVEVLLKGNVVTGATAVFRSDFRKLILPIPADWMHDAWVALLISAVADLAIIADPLIDYRQHGAQQIGAMKMKRGRETTVFDMVRTAVAEAWADPCAYVGKWDDDFIAYADRYQIACDRLEAVLGSSAQPVLAKFRAKVRHLRARALMSSRPLSRLPMVARELLSLRYHRYSSGMKGAGRDLVRALLFWAASPPPCPKGSAS